MTNLDSILKSRDISQGYIFPVVMYGCESYRRLSAKELMLLNFSVEEDS